MKPQNIVLANGLQIKSCRRVRPYLRCQVLPQMIGVGGGAPKVGLRRDEDDVEIVKGSGYPDETQQKVDALLVRSKFSEFHQQFVVIHVATSGKNIRVRIRRRYRMMRSCRLMGGPADLELNTGANLNWHRGTTCRCKLRN